MVALRLPPANGYQASGLGSGVPDTGYQASGLRSGGQAIPEGFKLLAGDKRSAITGTK